MNQASPDSRELIFPSGEKYCTTIGTPYPTAKHKDYGPKNIAEAPGGALNGLRVRIHDKIARINNTTSYGLALNGIKARIKNAADRAGAIIDETTLAQYAQEAYDTNQDSDAYTLQGFIDNKLTFGADKEGFYKGEAGKAISELQKVARANGLDLNKAFGSSLAGWVQAINKGEDIETPNAVVGKHG